MNIVKQVAIILLAGLVVVALALPLSNTEWAEGLRTETGVVEEGFSAEEGASVGEEEGREMSSGVMLVMPIMKQVFMMGIPGLITLGVLKLTRRFRGKKKQRRTRQTAEATA
ncbi:MAG: hypothetical protein DWQ04_00750 [Chloroflexi bacterium]|nr:MAG: hypothetical protein DWQ04_00750 [Chloroflexota bacterium]